MSEDEALERMLQLEEARRLGKEQALEEIPRWRFRRRRVVEQQLNRRRARAETLRDAIGSTGGDARAG